MKLLVLADDFTGANDTGVQLAKKGADVHVMLDWQNLQKTDSDVSVINLESRAQSAKEAQHRVVQALSTLDDDTLIFKKIDSTLRGNVGAEIEAVLNTTASSLAIVAPAIPAAGRTTRNGCCYVHGVALLETEFASDPKTPIHSSSIKEIIALQTDLPIHSLTTEEINYQALEQLDGIVILDAENDQELAKITDCLLAIKKSYILVGAAGLANALSPSLYCQKKAILPALLIAGSMSETTHQQVVQAAERNDVQVINIDVEKFLSSQRQQAMQQVIIQAVNALKSQQHTILSTCQNSHARQKIDPLCQKYQLDRNQLADTICNTLAQITRQIINQAPIGGLVLTGGDVAITTAKALKATGYRIRQEVAPCIPWGHFINSEFDLIPVITKAGGFGHKETLCDCIRFIEENRL